VEQIWVLTVETSACLQLNETFPDWAATLSVPEYTFHLLSYSGCESQLVKRENSRLRLYLDNDADGSKVGTLSDYLNEFGAPNVVSASVGIESSNKNKGFRFLGLNLWQVIIISAISIVLLAVITAVIVFLVIRRRNSLPAFYLITHTPPLQEPLIEEALFKITADLRNPTFTRDKRAPKVSSDQYLNSSDYTQL